LSATVVGYVGNALYPGRAGEVLRVAALHHAIRAPPGEALASAFMDRMADVVALTLATLYVLAFVARESLGSIGLQLSQLREHIVEINEECALHVCDAPPGARGSQDLRHAVSRMHGYRRARQESVVYRCS
jgi:hypothetical protein